jgi:pilus assembly protein CpaC
MTTQKASTPNSAFKENPKMLALFSKRSYVINLLLATVATLSLGLVSTIHAQETTYDASFSSNVKEAIPINVLVGQSRVINFDRPIGRFSISNPEIAEAVMVRPDQVLVNGKAFGQVNFIAWEKSDSKFIVFDVFVRANLSLIDSQIRALFPRDDIRLSQANGSVVLSGTVADPATAAQADSVVQAAGFKTVNMLGSPVKSATQVQLQIRVAEVSRAKLRDLGASFAYQGSPGAGGFASGGGPGSLSDIAGGVLNTTFNSAANIFLMGGNTLQMIRAMQTNGTLRALAEPNLIAMDGQVASFLAGGEFPIPVIQAGGGGGNSVTIQFKEYGIRLNFKPTIIDEDHIRLELEPEVSTIDFANGVRFQGFVVPALRTRRARTGVELRDGQSFALAGLLDNSETRNMSKVPVIGDIPIIGNLFKSTQFQKNETELVFIVTADVVKPINRDDIPTMRGIDGLKNGSPLGIEPKGEGISGASGFSTGSGQQAPAATPEAPKKTTPATPTGAAGVKPE